MRQVRRTNRGPASPVAPEGMKAHFSRTRREGALPGEVSASTRVTPGWRRAGGDGFGRVAEAAEGGRYAVADFDAAVGVEALEGEFADMGAVLAFDHPEGVPEAGFGMVQAALEHFTVGGGEDGVGLRLDEAPHFFLRRGVEKIHLDANQ